MATHSIFGDGPPSGVTTNNGDSAAVNLGTAFQLVEGVSDWAVLGAKVWIPADSNTPTTGLKAHLWAGSNIATATQLATADFATITKGAWNEVQFSGAQVIDPDTKYWMSVYFPGGCYPSKPSVFTSAVQSPTNDVLSGAAATQVTPGNGVYAYGAAGTAPINASTSQTWYGVDVLVADSGGGGRIVVDEVGVTDAVSAIRTGLPATVTFSGSATDTLGATAFDTAVAPVAAGTSAHVATHTMYDNNVVYGSALSQDIRGPVQTVAAAQEIGVTFWLDRPCRGVGAKIWKHPNAAGTIPVTLWTKTGTSLATTTVTWVADAGGYRTITFPTPATLDKDVEYRISYHAANGMYGKSDWVFNAQDILDPPFKVIAVGNGTVGGSCVANGTAHTFPTAYHHANFYIHPTVEWDVELPADAPGYMDQWPNYNPSATFPMGVFYADPPWFEDYCSIGVTTFVGIPTIVAGYREAILATGCDVWASAGENGEGAQYMLSDPELAQHIVGYFLVDEPDLAGTYKKPQYVRDVVSRLRAIDSTRPTMQNFGYGLSKMSGWFFLQIGMTINDAVAEWMEHVEIPDVTSLDHYNLMPPDFQGYEGVWTYPRFITRLKTMTSNKKPIWGYVETTGPIPNNPTPAQVKQATWAQIIAGAQGIVFFDHRFPNVSVTLDFAALLHDPPMRAAVQELCTTVHAMGGALLAGEKGYVTAVTSSNTTAGPMGGTYGVPIHTRSVSDATYRYVLAQAIRPGATTGTITVPSAANKTLTVLNENRTINVGSDGVITESFAADYSFHLYRWTP